MKERLEVIISANAAKFQAGMQKAESAMKGFKEQAPKVSKAIKEAMDKATSYAKTAAGHIGKALTGIAAGIGLLTASTEEFRQNQAQLNAAFEQAGFSAQHATGIYRELYKTIGDDDQAVESAANIAMLASSEKEAAEWAELASGVLGTFHDTLQPEAFYEAANETLKLGEATGAFTQMLEQTGVMSVDEFNQKLAACTTEAEKQQLMLEVSQQAMGEAGAAYDAQTAKLQAQREAQAKLNETLGKLADAVTPLVTAFFTFANNALQPVIEKIAPLAEKYAPALQEAMSKAGEAVGKAFGFFIDNWGILAAIAGVIAGIATAIGIYNTVIAIQTGLETARAAATWLSNTALYAQAAAMWAAYAPLLPWIALIAAVIAIVVVAIKHWDEIKEAVLNFAESFGKSMKETWEKAKECFNAIKDIVVEKVTGALTAVKQAFENIKNAIVEKVQGAKDMAVSIFESLKSGITQKIQSAKDTISNIASTIKSVLSFSGLAGIVSGVFESIKSGIKSKLDSAKSAVQSAIDAIKAKFNFSWSLPKLKLPHVKISGSFSLSPPRVPSFSVSWYKHGGVFDGTTLFGYGNGQIGGLGEAGAEAVLPLEHPANRGWVNAIASAITEAMGGGKPLVLMVDETKLGEVAAKGINNITMQTGNMPLVLP